MCSCVREGRKEACWKKKKRAQAGRRPLALVRPVAGCAALRHANHLDDEVLLGVAHGKAPAVRLRRRHNARSRARAESTSRERDRAHAQQRLGT